MRGKSVVRVDLRSESFRCGFLEGAGWISKVERVRRGPGKGEHVPRSDGELYR